MFDHWAELYDRVYAARGKDYACEADAILQRIASMVSLRPQARLLDVACGTGEHLRHFQRACDVEGLDVNPAMLTVAQRKLPGVPLHQQDMTAINLPLRFDVITCMFASIGYLPDEQALHAAIRSMAAHLHHGGVIAIEPAITPDRLQPPREDTMRIEEPYLALTRRTTARVHHDSLEITFNYVVTRPTGIGAFTDVHRVRLFTREQYEHALDDAGLIVTHDEHGLNGQGLYFATHKQPSQRDYD